MLDVLDGQHRILAFDALCRDDTDKKRLPLDRVVLPVVQYRVHNLAELTAYYTRINQHKPVHPLELRDSWQSFERPLGVIVLSTPRHHNTHRCGGV